MADNSKGERFNMTQPATMIHPNLLTARKFKDSKGRESGEAKFDAKFAFMADHPDIPGMKGMMMAAARAKWPGRTFSADRREFAWPHIAGEKWADNRKAKGKDGEYARPFGIVLTARSQYEIGLALLEGNKIVDLATPQLRKDHIGKFYSGTLSLASFSFVAYDGVGQNPDGVTAYLNSVLTLNRGDRIGGGPQSAKETFSGYLGNMSTTDPTQGAVADDMSF